MINRHKGGGSSLISKTYTSLRRKRKSCRHRAGRTTPASPKVRAVDVKEGSVKKKELWGKGRTCEASADQTTKKISGKANT